MDANKAHQKGLRSSDMTYEWHPAKTHIRSGRYWIMCNGRQIAEGYDLMDVADFIGHVRQMEERVAARAQT